LPADRVDHQPLHPMHYLPFEIRNTSHISDSATAPPLKSKSGDQLGREEYSTMS
jgi:hypothetical protein